MSHENVDVVRAAYEAWNVRDMDAFRELHDPDTIIVRGLQGWPEAGPFVGREAVMRLFEGLRETCDEETMELISLIDEVTWRIASTRRCCRLLALIRPPAKM